MRTAPALPACGDASMRMVSTRTANGLTGTPGVCLRRCISLTGPSSMHATGKSRAQPAHWPFRTDPSNAPFTPAVQDRPRFEGVLWQAHYAACWHEVLPVAAAIQLFRVPDDLNLTRAQFDALSAQVPLLYFILMSVSRSPSPTYRTWRRTG